MHSKKVMISIGITFGVILFVIFLFLLFPKIELTSLSSEVGMEYVPKVSVHNVFSDLSSKVIIENNVNNQKVGEYEVVCKVNYLFFLVKKTFIVSIVDAKPPKIVLNGKLKSYVCKGKSYVEEGYEAYDDYDKDITNKVKVNKTDDSITYSVKDSSNNEFSITREIIYDDIEAPAITLKGDLKITLYVGDKYVEPGYTGSDNCDGDITSKVTVKNLVNTNQAGTYTIEYTVSDTSMRSVSVKRTVVVKKRTTTGNGAIYLTFDDGSSNLTKEILDILDKENIKATFFVIRVNDLTKRAYESGHTIGLHSNTHNYKYIYTSSENYFKDLKSIQDKVYEATGYKSNIIRFPGGSSNTISRNYKKGIMTYLTKEVKKQGYIYFDWNVDSNDAGSDVRNSTKIYKNVINQLSHNKTNVVLMHDSENHRATVNALSSIIAYGKNNGYVFKPITSETPVIVHGVNN